MVELKADGKAFLADGPYLRQVYGEVLNRPLGDENQAIELFDMAGHDIRHFWDENPETAWADLFDLGDGRYLAVAGRYGFDVQPGEFVCLVVKCYPLKGLYQCL